MKRITLDVQESFLNGLEVPEGHSRKQILETMLQESKVSTENPTNGLQQVDPFWVSPNPYQPRGSLDMVSLQELAEDIEANGLLQPITVRQTSSEGYQAAFGHRRLAAWKMLYKKHGKESKWGTMPCFIKPLDDEEMYRAAAAENGQREQLSVIEVAKSIQKAKELGISQQEAGRLHGYASKGTVSSIVGLLELPLQIQEMVTKGDLGFGHGRELVRLVKAGFETSDIVDYAERTVSLDLKVSVLKNNVDMQLEAKRQKQTLETRYCYWCNHEQQVSDYDKINHISTQCEACGKKTFAYQWLTEKKTCARCAKELDSERVFDYSQYHSEPICPDCYEQQKPEIVSRYCPDCYTATTLPKEAWSDPQLCGNCDSQPEISHWHDELPDPPDPEPEPEPPQETETASLISLYCPKCLSRKDTVTASLDLPHALHCSPCGYKGLPDSWLREEPKASRRYCPTCHNATMLSFREINGDWTIECHQCGDVNHTHQWLLEKPEPTEAELQEEEFPQETSVSDEELQEALTAQEYATFRIAMDAMSVRLHPDTVKALRDDIIGRLLGE